MSAIDRLFDNKFKFSKGTIIQGLKGEDINLFDKNFTDIERDHPELFKERFENNAITTKLYYNISDKEARQLFAEILNNTNKITAHIIRAASKHDIADVVRFLVRLNDASKYFDGKKEFLYNHYNLKRLEMFSGIVQRSLIVLLLLVEKVKRNFLNGNWLRFILCLKTWERMAFQ